MLGTTANYGSVETVKASWPPNPAVPAITAPSNAQGLGDESTSAQSRDLDQKHVAVFENNPSAEKGSRHDLVEMIRGVHLVFEQCSPEDRAELLQSILEVEATDALRAHRASYPRVAMRRLPALLATLCLELFAAMVVSQLNDVLQAIILLASFLPVISAVSGNAGLQASTTTIRAFGLGLIQKHEWRSTLAKEAATNAITGLACGVVLGIIAGAWAHFGSDMTTVPAWKFGSVVGFSLTCSMIMASIMGVIAPFVFARIGIDPAHTVGPFETSFQDIVGYTVFLLLAKALLT